MLGRAKRWLLLARERASDARAMLVDLLEAFDELRKRWEYDSPDTQLELSRKRRLHASLFDARKRQLVNRPAQPPASSQRTEFLLATLKPGNLVRLSNGESHEVIEPPYTENGWQMVKVSPRHAPRPGTTDPHFLLVPLTIIESVGSQP